MANNNFRPIRLLTNSFKITELPKINYNQYSGKVLRLLRGARIVDYLSLLLIIFHRI